MASCESLGRSPFRGVTWTVLLVALAILTVFVQQGFCQDDPSGGTGGGETTGGDGTASNGENNDPATEVPVVNENGTTSSVDNAGVSNGTDNGIAETTQTPVETGEGENNVENSNETTVAPDTEAATTAANTPPDTNTNDSPTTTLAPPGTTTAPPSPCDSNPCLNGGTCTEPPEGNFHCNCSTARGWTGDTCATDVDECAAEQSPCVDTNSVCNNTDGLYRCDCKAGYFREADGDNCTDINECSNATSACPDTNSNCTNTAGSFTCDCNTGYTRLADGVNCTDVDECKTGNFTCVDTNTECKNTAGSYTCACKTGFERVGTDNCTDINECANNSSCPDTNSQCNNMEGSFTCDCKDGFERTPDGANCTDVDECKTGNFTCVDTNTECENTAGSYTCACKTGFERVGTDNCTDINECANNSSCPDTNSQCNNMEGSFTCDCKDGFERTPDGANCTDIDECEMGVCGENTVFCENRAGNYACRCRKGWTGVNCTDDVDECTADPLVCSDTNSECRNSDGSFSCPCKSGFERVTPNSKCTEQVLLSFNNNVTSRLSGDDDIFGPFYVPEGFMMHSLPHIYYFVSINGYITFDTKLNRKFALEPNSPVLKDRTVIAPYWSDIEIPAQNTTTGLYHVEISLADKLGNGTLAAVFDEYETAIGGILGVQTPPGGFKPVYIAVWTWDNVRPYTADNYRDIQGATFQAVLTTDGQNSFAILNYRSVWPASVDVAVDRMVQTLNTTGIAQQETGNPLEEDTPRQVVYSFQSATTLSVTNTDCIEWAYGQDKSAVPSGAPCPCSKTQAQRDFLFSFDSNTNCATSRMWNSDGVKSVCCYSAASGMLLKSYQDYQRHSPILFRDSALSSSQQDGLHKCCSDSSSLCHRFYDIYPLDTCSSYTPPMAALLWGDPHLKSVDGTEFNFNGWGEYDVLQSDDESFMAQGRTEKLLDVNVTVFKAIAVQSEDDPKVEVRHSGVEQVSVMINGTDEDFTSGPVTLNFTYIGKENGGKTVVIVFASHVAIKVNAQSDRLALQFAVPPHSLTNAKGLLGHVDGNKTNDFTFRNGTVLTGSMADLDSQDIFAFGQSWLIPFENQSLFTYNATNTFASYQHPDFTPTFLPTTVEEVLTALNETGRMDTGEALCGRNLACLQDFLVTNNTDTANATKQLQENVDEAQELLAQRPPEFESPREVWNVSLSSGTFSYNVMVKAGADGTFPNITVNAASNLNYTFSEVAETPGTWQFSWILTEDLASMPQINITFTATDEMGMTAEYTPIIMMCACDQESQCYYPTYPNFTQDFAMRGTPFYSLDCHCGMGKGGRFCKDDIPVCDSCFANASCNENATDGNYCQACPDGYTGDGIKCYEVNECLEPGKCDHICQNTVGNYTCSCRSGYKLEGRSTCTDVNECAEKEDNCSPSQFCHNTDGSFTCVCRPKTGGNSCQEKVSYVYVGRLVFIDSPDFDQGWSPELTDPSSSAFTKLAEKVQTQVNASVSRLLTPPVYGVTVIAFEQLSTVSERKKRSVQTSKPLIQATFQVDTSTPMTMSKLDSALDNGFDPSCTGDLCSFGESGHLLFGVSRNMSSFDPSYDLCSSDRLNDCHDPSTNCTSTHGTYSCACREGYRPWDLFDNACEDIDECEETSVTEICGTADATCRNTMGSYVCDCLATHYWNGSTCELYKCEDSPCKNGATCVNIGEQSTFACKCAYGYTGPTCTDEDSEAIKMRNAVIGVAAGLGTFCVLLIIIIVIVCIVRGRRKDGGGSLHSNGNYSIPRPRVKTDSTSEMSREDSMHKYTKFRRSGQIDAESEGAGGSGEPGTHRYSNPVYTPDEKL